MKEEQHKVFSLAMSYAKIFGFEIKEADSSGGGPCEFEISKNGVDIACRMTPEHCHGFMIAVLSRSKWQDSP